MQFGLKKKLLELKAGLWVPNTINANVKNESLKVKVNLVKIIITFHVTGKLPLPKGGISVCFKVTIYLQLTQSPFTFNLLHLPFDTIKDMKEDYYQKNLSPKICVCLKGQSADHAGKVAEKMAPLVDHVQ